MEKTDTHTEKPSFVSAKTFGICIAGVAIAIVAISVFKVPISTIGFVAILLACPLMHIWMMKDGSHKH